MLTGSRLHHDPPAIETLGRRDGISFPKLHAVAFKNDGAVSSMDFQSLRHSWIEGSGTIDNADGAVLVLDQGLSNVFDFNGMRGRSGLGLNGMDATHDPLNHIDHVDPLVHQAASAVHDEGASPVSTIVICLGAIPLDIGIAGQESSEFSTLRRLAKSLDGGGESMLADGGEFDSRAFASFDKGAGFWVGHVDRFLDDDVLTTAGSDQANIGMATAGSADDDDVGFGEEVI